MFPALFRRSRRAVVAAAAVTVLAPIAAGCAAGVNAQTGRPYSPTEGINAAVRNIVLRDVFILGPAPGTELEPGENAPMYGTIAGTSADRLVAVSTDDTFGAAKIGGGEIAVPADSAVRMARQPSVTARGLTKRLRGGEYVKVTFTFDRAGAISLHVPVIPRAHQYATFPPAPTPSSSSSPSSSSTSSATRSSGG